MRRGVGPQKLLIYLDQNFVSEMAKLDSNRRVRSDFQQLFDVLHAGFKAEKLVVLRSTFHELESSLAGSLRDPIRGRQAMLGHVHLRHPRSIRERQLERALMQFLGRPDAREVIQHDDAFSECPDQRVTHLDIDVNMDWRFAGAQAEREDLASRLDTVRQRIRSGSISYEEQYRTELTWTRHDMLGRGKTVYYTRLHEVTEEAWRQFVLSDHFAQIPSIHLDIALLAKLMTAHSHRVIKRGDVTDLDAMATYLPYCDIYATDTLVASISRQLNVSLTYDCNVFDGQRDDGQRLLSYLRDTLAALEPVNRPSMSIFVAPDASIKEHSFSFFRTLGLQAKRAEAAGMWVEVFGFNDGAMPRYEHRDIPGVPVPFCGLQEVNVISCQHGETREHLVEACRKWCRSVRFMLIDRYQQLPDDFTQRALNSYLTGEQHVLSYPIYDHDVREREASSDGARRR